VAEIDAKSAGVRMQWHRVATYAGRIHAGIESCPCTNILI